MNKKRVLIIIIAIIVVILITLIVVNKSKEDQEQKEIESYLSEYEGDVVMETSVYPVDNASEFFSVAFNVNIYLNYIAGQNKEAVYNLLDKDYIKEAEITEDNVLDNVEEITEIKIFEVNEMYAADSYYCRTYFIYGTMRSDIMDEIGDEEDFYVTVKVDIVNPAFSIIPNTIRDIQSVNELYNDYIVDPEGEGILANNYNSFKYSNVTEQALVNMYLNDYKNNALYNAEKAYESLDKEYRERRFGDISEYKRYIEANMEKISKIALDRYQINNMESYKQYILVDKMGNYYIFNETAIKQYKLILDTYTLDLPEFIEAYNSTTAQGKVALNIQKFTDSINNKDYRYSYNKLSEGFKNNQFPTLQSFENYINRNIPQNSRIEYGNFKEEAGIYTYDISFVSEEGQVVTKTIIMQLKGDTDFVLSFNME